MCTHVPDSYRGKVVKREYNFFFKSISVRFKGCFTRFGCHGFCLFNIRFNFISAKTHLTNENK